MGPVLLVCGGTLVVVGSWRGYRAARLAVAPFVHEGEPTRSAVEQTRPVLARARVTRALRQTSIAVAWILLAMYGLFLFSIGQAGQP